MVTKLKALVKTISRKAFNSLAAAGILAMFGIILLTVAIASQQRAPTPSPTAAGTINSSAMQKLMGASGPILAYSKPVSLGIPAINVSSQLIEVGQNPNGSIQVPVPPSFDHAAWYKYSPAPGQFGASVIIGHIDNRYTGPSIFFNLGKLKPRDVIKVKRADNKTAIFTITAVRQYLKSDFPTAQVYTSSNDAELRLITCGGSFNQSTRHYTDNTIVFAKLTRSYS